MADMTTPTTPAAAQPNLGYGKPTEATIDQVNIWMRGQPWYQEQMRQWGQDPGHPNLAKSQSEQILRMAQAQGVKVDQGNMEVDDHGNFNPVGHKLRNTLIVAGIAAAGIAAPYIIPAIAGAGGGGSAAAGLSAVEGGGFGIGSGTVAALGTGAMAGVPVAAGTTAAGLTTAGLTAGLGPSTGANIAGTAAVANSAPAGIAAGGGMTAGGGTLANMASRFVNNGGLSDVAGAIGRANTAAGNNRLNQQGLTMQANRDNIAGTRSYETMLQERAAQEAALRKQALRDVTLANDVRNPHISQFNTRGPVANTPEYMSAMSELEKRGLSRLQQQDAYTTDKLPALQPYQPLPTDANGLQDRTGTKKSILETVGDYAGPAMSIYSNYFRG
jgi:hypothetical protein